MPGVAHTRRPGAPSAGIPTGFFDLAHTQRAHRAFGADPVPDEVVARILAAAVCAPSAENAQPWEFVVVRDVRLREAIGELTARVWTSGAREAVAGTLSPTLLADVDAGARGGVANAPVLVVVCAHLRRCRPDTVGSSIFPAVQNILLGAAASGLGAALTTLPTVADGPLSELLGLPAEVRPVAVVPLGHPARPLGPPRRDPFEHHTHRDRYGTPW